MAVEIIYDWEGSKTSFIKAYQAGYDAGSK
jgi:hypothetical protein